MKRVGLFLWTGNIGGAEVATAALAAEMRALGVDARVLFVQQAGALAARLEATGVPFAAYGAGHSSATLLHCRRFTRWTRLHAPDGVVLSSPGHLAVALRLGGYAAAVVATEHGQVLMLSAKPRTERWVRRIEMWLGSRAADTEVAVSGFVARAIEEHHRPPRLVVVHNGVTIPPEPSRPASSGVRTRPSPVVIAAGSRLAPGKGIDHLLRAVAALPTNQDVRLDVAGDGPERGRLEALARALGLGQSVRFLGWLDDMPAFWRGCDIAVTPSAELVESFGMTALEAMACGKPVVACRNGGLAEVVADAATGLLVEPGDVSALAAGLRMYIADGALRAEHGAAGRARAEATFGLRRTAAAYLALLSVRAGAVSPGMSGSPRSPKTAHRVSVVVVTLNSAACVEDCIDSLRRPFDAAELIVVDNGSSDDTVARARSVAPESKVITGHGNIGFGRACNLGAAHATGTHILFLNPDARVVANDPAGLHGLWDRQPFGIVGLGVRAPPPATDRGIGLRRERHWTRSCASATLGLVRPRELPAPRAAPRGRRHGWVSGGAMLVGRQEFERVGGFDPRFFMYHEDRDLSRRFIAHGLPVTTTRCVTVVHRGGGSVAGDFDARRTGWCVLSELEYIATWDGDRTGVRAAAAMCRALAALAAVLRAAGVVLRRSARIRRKRDEIVVLRRFLAGAVDPAVPRLDASFYPSARQALRRATRTR